MTIEDPTVWTRPWTVKQEFTRQSDEQNRIYYEPRCVEGNYGLPGLMRAARVEDACLRRRTRAESGDQRQRHRTLSAYEEIRCSNNDLHGPRRRLHARSARRARYWLRAVAARPSVPSFRCLHTPAMAQAPPSSATTPASSLKTPWGEPDLQGIWTDESDTPLQRAAEIREPGSSSPTSSAPNWTRSDRRCSAATSAVERGTELDVAGAYNAVFTSMKRTGARTSLIVDPPNGRLPPMTPEAQKIAAADRAFRLALLQSTETCKNKSVACAGGKYDPTPSPRRAELPPRYNTARMNRHDGPEDGALPDRCLTLGLPEFGAATAAASAGSCRRRAASRCSTMWARARAGSATSS